MGRSVIIGLFWSFLYIAGSQASAFTFENPITIPTGMSPRGIGIGKVFDGGNPDLVVANFGYSTFIGQTTPATLLNPQNSSLQVFSPSPQGLRLTQTIATANSPRGVCLFDMNQKGYKDIFVTNYDSKLLQVFEWKKSNFVKVAEKMTGEMPVGITAGFTAPGGAPFAGVANFGSNTLSLYKISGSQLSDKLDVPTSEGPTQLAIGDLNGDGVNEIVVACLSAHRVDILSKMKGSKEDDLSSYAVSKSLSLGMGSSPADLRVEDLNRDGKADLVVADFNQNMVYVFYQQNDGTLSDKKVISTSGNHPNGLTVADLFGDGEKEIIVANRDSDSIDIFGRVNGNYQLMQTVKVEEETNSSFGPVEVGVMDTTGQGKPGLVCSHMRSNTLKVVTLATVESEKVKSLTVGSAEGSVPFSEKTTYCYPNPTHDGKVKFSFSLSTPSIVDLQVFNVRGEVVWSQKLLPSQTLSGVNILNWDGVNQAGESLASGLYLYKLRVGDKTVTKKVAILH